MSQNLAKIQRISIICLRANFFLGYDFSDVCTQNTVKKMIDIDELYMCVFESREIWKVLARQAPHHFQNLFLHSISCIGFFIVEKSTQFLIDSQRVGKQLNRIKCEVLKRILLSVRADKEEEKKKKTGHTRRG